MARLRDDEKQALYETQLFGGGVGYHGFTHIELVDVENNCWVLHWGNRSWFSYVQFNFAYQFEPNVKYSVEELLEEK